MEDKNTKAKYLLEDVDFSHAGAHLAYTLGSGAASMKNEAYLFKSDEKLSDDDRYKAVELAKGITYRQAYKLLEEGLRELLSTTNLYLEDFTDVSVTYEVYFDSKETYYNRPYTYEDGALVFGEAVEVERVTSFVAKSEDKELPPTEGTSVEAEVPTEIDSDAISESVDKTADNGIDTNGEDSMSDDKVVDEATQLSDLQKSMEVMQKALDAAEAARKDAEDKAAEIEKAANEQRIEKAKADLTDVVKAWDLDNSDDVVEALFKAEASDVIITTIEAMHQRIEKAKKDFGTEEHGIDGESAVVTDVTKTKESVAAILKARKAKKA